MKQSEEDKRKADLITIIELKQAALDAQVSQLGAQKRKIDQRRRLLADTTPTPQSADDLLWLGRAYETSQRESARLDQRESALEADIRKTLSGSVSLEIAKRKLKNPI